MRNDRSLVLAVERVLREYSDEGHILSMGEIRELLFKDYDIYPDRRTVTAAMETLADFGLDISMYNENRKGYFLRERNFEISELRLLMDAIYSFKGIPPKQSSELIEKIQRDMSRYQRKNYRQLRSVKPAFKTKNKQVFLNIELIDEAITNGRKISFLYNRYDFDLQLKPLKAHSYIVSPYLMLSANERYYMIGVHDSYDDLSHYRLDRMTDISIIKEKRKPLPSDCNLKDYMESASKIYFGQEERFTFRCKRTILDDCMDRFGTDIVPFNITGETFDFSVKVVDKAGIFFALEYISRCEILSPESARDRMKRYIKSGTEKYL